MGEIEKQMDRALWKYQRDVGGTMGPDEQRFARQAFSSAIDALRKNDHFIAAAYDGIPFTRSALLATIAGALPAGLEQRGQFAYRAVPTVMTGLFGPEGSGWVSEGGPGRYSVRALRPAS